MPATFIIYVTVTVYFDSLLTL